MNLTLATIENCSVGELFNYAREFNVVASNTWELKQKLIVKVMRMNGSIIDLSGYTESAKQEKEAAIIEDEKRRKRLEIFLNDVRVIYNKIKSFEKIKEPLKGENKIEERDDPLLSLITHEMPTIDEDFEKMPEMVKNKPNCSLLICGDSGAGKSSFINLLISTDMLPTSIRSNSSCLVRLTYGEPERAEIIDLDSKKHIIERSEFSTKLNSYLENIEDRKTMSCKSATIFLKSMILEGGLDIYDTIGLGETEMFNNELKKELNQITGILFLLKKNNPIGDTTIGGLSQIIHQLALNGLPWGSMNFIINMCDLLQGNEEKENLKRNVMEQLRQKCTLINPEITTFSTKQELDFQKNNVMTTNYKDIIQMINNLHISSINTNTVKVFSFLMKFVLQTIDQINELEKYSASNTEERKNYILKLRNLECDRKLINQSFKKENQKYLNSEKKSCRKKVEEYFRKIEIKELVVQGVIDKMSDLYGMTVIDEINKKIEEMTHEEISMCFKGIIEKDQILKKCCEKMLNLFVQQFAEHQKKKDVIHKEMNRHISSVMDVIEYNFKEIVSAPSQNKGFLHLVSPILIPIVNVRKYISKANWFSHISEVFNKKNIQTFYQDTITYVTREASSKYSDYFHRSSNIKSLVECLFKAPEQVTTDFEKYLTDDMDYLAKNIHSLEEDMRKKEKVFSTYKEIKEHLTSIYESLCQFSLLRLQKEKRHIMQDKISFLQAPNIESDNIKPILKGRSRLVFNGQAESETCLDSCIMVYKNKDNKKWKDLYNEYRKHNDISAMKLYKNDLEVSKCFLELSRHVIFYMEDKIDMMPTFLVSGVDCSLNTFMKEKREESTEKSQNPNKFLYDEICKVLKQILLGLSYLHSNSLVHYDLTGDSIGYSRMYQSVKLTSISLPTKVKVKYEKNSKDYVLKMAHFPISVLVKDSDSLYDDDSDIYCLGILLYSMWMGIHPFYDVIFSKGIENITEFVQTLRINPHNSIILSDTLNHGFAHLIYNWSCRCRDGKIDAKRFLEELNVTTYYGVILN